MSSTVNAEMLFWRKPLHDILERADFGVVFEQAHHIAGLGPHHRDIRRDIASQTPGVIIEAIAGLGFEAVDLETWVDRTEVHGHAVMHITIRVSSLTNISQAGNDQLSTTTMYRGTYSLNGPVFTQPPP